MGARFLPGPHSVPRGCYGRPMRTEVIRSERRKKTVQARLVDGVLRVMIPASMSAAEEERWVTEMTRKVGRKTEAAGIDLMARARSLATQYDLPEPAEIRFSARQRTLWGSCSPDRARIRISDRIAAFPCWVVDYVIVHELAHLGDRSHSRRFWRIVNRYPLAERARGYLMAKGGEEPA